VPPEEDLLDEEDNWLHEAWIACPACQRSLFRIDTSPFDHESYLYCDHCPTRVGVSVYEAEFDQIIQSLPSALEAEEKRAALCQAIEANLKPCSCGGAFRYNAPRRCFSCAAPVIIENPAGVDLYPDEDIFQRALAPERQEQLDCWQAQFMPPRLDKWKAPA
jgi:hypothetical protein